MKRVALVLIGLLLVGCGNADLARNLAARGDKIIAAQSENMDLALDRLATAQGNARNGELRALLRATRAAVEAKKKVALPAVKPEPLVPPIPTGSPDATTQPSEVPDDIKAVVDALTGGTTPVGFDPWAKLESELLEHLARRREDHNKINDARSTAKANAAELRKVLVLMVRSAEAYGDKEEVKAEIDQLRGMILELAKTIAASRKEK